MPAPALLSILQHARAEIPYYRELLPVRWPQSPSLFWKRFNRVPILTRATLQREAARFTPPVAIQPGWQWTRSSGSTGEPVTVVLDPAARQKDADVFSRSVDACLGSTEWRSRTLIRAALHAGGQSICVPAPWNPQVTMCKWNLLYLWQQPDAVFGERLFRGGEVVALMPSIAWLIAHRLERSAIPLKRRPSLIVLSGEPIDPMARQRIEKAFGAPSLALFTLAEFGVIGTECPHGGYHVATDSVHVELVGRAGEMVVTGLINRAMPLIRYRTGDTAAWLGPDCSCGQPGPRFAPRSTRRPVHLLTPDGRGVNTVRFAKLLNNLGLERYRFDQDGRGAVKVHYQAANFATAETHRVVTSAIRTAVGPSVEVTFQRMRRADRPTAPAGAADTAPAEPPSLANVEELSRWLRERLRRERGVQFAALTGSALSPGAMSRQSDIDVVLLGARSFPPEHWSALAQELRAADERVRLMYDRLPGLAKRAPLFACRLRCENLPLRGRLDAKALPWPTRAALLADARFWAQTRRIQLTHRIINGEKTAGGAHSLAWQTIKLSLDALRYGQLLGGSRETAAEKVIARAHGASRIDSDWLRRFDYWWDIARELVPPPLVSPAMHVEIQTLALDAMAWLDQTLER